MQKNAYIIEKNYKKSNQKLNWDNNYLIIPIIVN